MPAWNDVFPRFSPVGESALLVELGNELSFSVNERVHQLDAQIRQAQRAGILACVPGYASLLVTYDPLQINLRGVYDLIQTTLDSEAQISGSETKCVEIPVIYGGEYGPDLFFVAKANVLPAQFVVEKHTEPIYRVGMMGFTPGFPYLLGLDPDLATPRRKTPRMNVPAGSIGIAGGQTGIYPLESPGGWQIIGRTQLGLYDPIYEPHFLLSPGDEVRFVAERVIV